MADDGHDDDGNLPYSSYAVSIYQNGIIAGQLPVVTTDPNGLEAQAKATMDRDSFGYVFGGAGEMSTMDANRLAFRQWRIVPRYLRPNSPRDLSVNLFGVKYGRYAPNYSIKALEIFVVDGALTSPTQTRRS